MAEYYRFDDEQVAIESEAYLCKKAAELGMPFSGTTNRFAVPVAERLPLPTGSTYGDTGVPTGKWIYPSVPDDVVERMPESVIEEFMTLYNPEIIEE